MRFSRSFLTVPNLVVGGFFGLLLLLGLALHRDYGVSWDELTDRQNGQVNLKYIGQLLAPRLASQEPTYQAIPPLKGYGDNDHGVLFEIVAAGVGLLLPRGDSVAHYHARHLLIFLSFWVGCLALYGLAKLRFQSWRWGLVAAGCLVVSPRFFAEAFFNGKDIVFMALFTLAMYTLARWLRRPTPGRLLLHALATAAAIDVRLLGLLLMGYTLGLLALRAYPFSAVSLKNSLLFSFGYLLVTAIFVVVGWPYLWEAPVTNFLAAYQSVSSYAALSQVRNLYFGRLFAHGNPWHYAPVWIIITTPLPYLAAAGIGLGTSLRQLWQRQPPLFARQLDLLVLLWLLGTLGSIIGRQFLLYNGWRLLYFVYPGLLLLAVGGAHALVATARRRGVLRYAALGLLVAGSVGLGSTVLTMMRMHPHENVYFSFLPARTAERLFDRDYWGLAYYQGLQWLLAHDGRPVLTVATPATPPLFSNELLLPPAERARLRYVPQRARARYFITNYRRHPQPYADSVGREIYTIRADGLKILSIFEQCPAEDR